MAVFSTYRYALRHRIMRLLNDGFLGTVSSPGSGTLVCEASAEWDRPDDFFNNFVEVYVYSGTNSGVSANPTDWTYSSHTLTFSPASTLSTDDLIEIHEKFYVSQYNESIDAAIEGVTGICLQKSVDTSITMAADTYEYDVPSGMIYVYRIDQEEEADSDVFNDQFPIDARDWDILQGSPAKIRFIKNLFEPPDGYDLRVWGLTRSTKLISDTDICSINPNYIAYEAASLLHSSLIQGTGATYDEHGHASLAAYWHKRALEVMGSAGFMTDLPQGSKEVER